MASVYFEVEGNPLPKQSFSYGSGKGRSHTPQRVKDWQELVAIRAKQAMTAKGLPLFEGKVAIHAVYVRCDRRRVDDGNLSKAVDDALNNIVWVDDSQVHYRITEKKYDKYNPGIKVKVWEL